MTRLTLDPIIRRQLSAPGEQVALCDDAGRIVGYYIPALMVSESPPWGENSVSDASGDAGCITTEELIRYLKSL